MRFEGRRSIRLRGYDYAQAGAYFVTICTQNRICLFGHISDGTMVPNDAGTAVRDRWFQIPERYPLVSLLEFMVMPNHLHGVILIQAPAIVSSARLRPAPLGQIVQWFKTGTTWDYIDGVKNHGWPPFERRLWQRNYYEHIIRDDGAYERIAGYIVANPSLWNEDALHPSAPEFLPRRLQAHQPAPEETD